MKIKVCDAPIEVLNYLVAKIEGHEWRCPWLLEKEGYVAWQSYEQAWGNPTPDYCTNWYEMGPIIDRVGIMVGRYWTYCAGGASQLTLTSQPTGAVASLPVICDKNLELITEDGPSPLVAAAKCYIVSKLGKEVEVPDELMVE